MEIIRSPCAPCPMPSILVNIFGLYSFSKEHSENNLNLCNLKSLEDFIKEVVFSINKICNDHTKPL